MVCRRHPSPLPSLTVAVAAALLGAASVGGRVVFGREGGGGDGFSRECGPFPGGRVVLVTVNYEFIDMFQNWLYHAKPFLTKTEHVVAFAEDAQVGEALRKLSRSEFGDLAPFTVSDPFRAAQVKQPTSLHRVVASGQQRQRQRVPFESAEFGSIVGKRPSHIAAFLERGCSVLYVDIDTVWTRSPFVDIANAGHHDLYVTDDTEKEGQWNICTCFLYVHPTLSARKLVKAWETKVKIHRHEHNDQPLFNMALKADHENEKTVDFARLPYSKFPAGLNAHKYGNATVYHANWRVGHAAKVQFLVEHGLYYTGAVHMRPPSVAVSTGSVAVGPKRKTTRRRRNPVL